MTTADRLLAEYADDHRHPVNRRLHSVCVPVIVISLLGLLRAAPVPAVLPAMPPIVNWATVVAVALMAGYLWRAPRLGAGMVAALLAALAAVAALQELPVALWQSSLALFAVGWIGQFIGHGYEGRRPSFFRDLRFLLVGPLWVMQGLYARLGLRG